MKIRKITLNDLVVLDRFGLIPSYIVKAWMKRRADAFREENPKIALDENHFSPLRSLEFDWLCMRYVPIIIFFVVLASILGFSEKYQIQVSNVQTILISALSFLVIKSSILVINRTTITYCFQCDLRNFLRVFNLSVSDLSMEEFVRNKIVVALNLSAAHLATLQKAHGPLHPIAQEERSRWELRAKTAAKFGYIDEYGKWFPSSDQYEVPDETGIEKQ